MPSAVLFSLLSFGSFFPCLLDPLFAHSSFLLDLQHCHIEHWVATVISSPQLKGKKGGGKDVSNTQLVLQTTWRKST